MITIGHSFFPEQSIYLIFLDGYLLSCREQTFLLTSPKPKWAELALECWTVWVMKTTVIFRESSTDRNWLSFHATFIENKSETLLASLSCRILKFMSCSQSIKVSSGLRWRASLFIVSPKIWFCKYLVQSQFVCWD